MAPSLDSTGYTEPSRIVTSVIGGCQGIRPIRKNRVRYCADAPLWDAMTTPRLLGFPPVPDFPGPIEPKVLILGSFPSARSLAAQQYYANPQNAFWRITSELFGFDPNAPYDARLAALLSHGVVLWDVLHACRRDGSADSAIDPKSLVVNDFAGLFARYPTITRVYFNGAKAAELFRRLADVPERIHCQRLPSTSPAHVLKPGEKLAAWQVISAS
jgi:hypoxanthine-DNA glycosylase